MTARFHSSDTLPRSVTIWLCIVMAMIVIMVMVGGVTRLTQSGLSMVDWRPIMGIIPPLTQLDWQDAFAAYKQFPEYKTLNYGMTMTEFKGIFLMEYSHRVWGRLIGLVFMVPLMWFFIRGTVRGPLAWKLSGLLLLGAAQGAMGWIMVKSGLSDDPSVSPYRLTAHLALAILIAGLILRMLLGAMTPEHAPVKTQDRILPIARISFVLAILTLLSGGFVAGLDAGMTYNTFPLMDGQLIPDGMWAMDPIWRNPFENITMVQFDHRVLGMSTAIACLFLWLRARNAAAPPRLALAINLTGLMAIAQPALGIMTLLLATPVTLAAAHQTGALILLGLLIWVVSELRADP
ncbi:MAG: COX15/CtaA family protein [Alphaproteobacteria bacterium]|jgi:cytochrome c oxidase assembly protein subunit 15